MRGEGGEVGIEEAEVQSQAVDAVSLRLCVCDCVGRRGSTTRRLNKRTHLISITDRQLVALKALTRTRTKEEEGLVLTVACCALCVRGRPIDRSKRERERKKQDERARG